MIRRAPRSGRAGRRHGVLAVVAVAARSAAACSLLWNVDAVVVRVRERPAVLGSAATVCGGLRRQRRQRDRTRVRRRGPARRDRSRAAFERRTPMPERDASSTTSAISGRRVRLRRAHRPGAYSRAPRAACFDQRMGDSLSATTIEIEGHDGDEIEAYLARPDGDEPRGGVVVIHHMPGYDRATKEIVRRFAELGYDAICPNLYWREAPGAAPDDAAAAARGQRRRARTSGWSATSPARRRTCARCRRPTARSASSGTARAGGRRCSPRCNARRRRRGRLLRRVRHRHAAGGLPAQGHQPRRPAAEPALPAARPVRQRGQVPDARAGRRVRADPQGQRQDLRVPPLRRRRARVLRRRPAVLPRRGGQRRLGAHRRRSTASTSGG